MARERIRPLRREKFEFARSTRQKMINPRPMTTPEAPVCTYAATVGCGERLQRLRGLACCRCGFCFFLGGSRRSRRGAPRGADPRARVRRERQRASRGYNALYSRVGRARVATRDASGRGSADERSARPCRPSAAAGGRDPRGARIRNHL